MEDFNDKWLRIHHDFGCDIQLDEVKFNKYLDQNLSWIGLYEDEDMLLQLGLWFREDLDKVRIHTYNIKLKSDNYTYDDLIHLINQKLIEYMNSVNCKHAYCVYSDVFESYPYFNKIKQASFNDDLIVNIDAINKMMEIDLVI